MLKNLQIKTQQHFVHLINEMNVLISAANPSSNLFKGFNIIMISISKRVQNCQWCKLWEILHINV